MNIFRTKSIEQSIADSDADIAKELRMSPVASSNAA